MPVATVRPWRGEGRELSPERNPVWTEPRTDKSGGKAKAVPVIYYLSRNSQLEHPHFMEVTLSSPEGLYLRDVIHRLNLVRGKGMASLYAWSSKRSYKNGFVWHDLTEDDFIYPAHGNEYVLKGSELMQIAAVVSSPPDLSSASLSVSSAGSASSSSSVSSDKDVLPAAPATLRKKPPPHRWGSLDLGEYKATTAFTTTKAAADAATQTDDTHRLRQWRRGKERSRSEIPDLEVPPHGARGTGKEDHAATTTTELQREEISPPPSSSSPETLETLIKADVGRARAAAGTAADAFEHQRDLGVYPTGRARASAVLINLISCGAISVKDHHATAVSPHISRQQQQRLQLRGGGVDAAADPRGIATNSSITKKEWTESRRFPTVQLEDKEYFSGSLIETKKKVDGEGAVELAALKRSNSYNADRSSKTVMEMDAVRSKCIPRKPKPVAAVISSSNVINNNNSRKDATGGAAVARCARISSAGEETAM